MAQTLAASPTGPPCLRQGGPAGAGPIGGRSSHGRVGRGEILRRQCGPPPERAQRDLSPGPERMSRPVAGNRQHRSRTDVTVRQVSGKSHPRVHASKPPASSTAISHAAFHAKSADSRCVSPVAFRSRMPCSHRPRWRASTKGQIRAREIGEGQLVTVAVDASVKASWAPECVSKRPGIAGAMSGTGA